LKPAGSYGVIRDRLKKKKKRRINTKELIVKLLDALR